MIDSKLLHKEWLKADLLSNTRKEPEPEYGWRLSPFPQGYLTPGAYKNGDYVFLLHIIRSLSTKGKEQLPLRFLYVHPDFLAYNRYLFFAYITIKLLKRMVIE